MSDGGKYLLYSKIPGHEVGHQAYGLDGDRRDPGFDLLRTTLLSTTAAFLDASVHGNPDAALWLEAGAPVDLSGGDAEFEAR